MSDAAGAGPFVLIFRPEQSIKGPNAGHPLCFPAMWRWDEELPEGWEVCPILMPAVPRPSGDAPVGSYGGGSFCVRLDGPIDRIEDNQSPDLVVDEPEYFEKHGKYGKHPAEVVHESAEMKRLWMRASPMQRGQFLQWVEEVEPEHPVARTSEPALSTVELRDQPGEINEVVVDEPEFALSFEQVQAWWEQAEDGEKDALVCSGMEPAELRDVDAELAREARCKDMAFKLLEMMQRGCERKDAERAAEALYDSLPGGE